MKSLLILLSTLLLLSVNVNAASKLTEKNINKTLNAVKVAKEHKNLKSMSRHFMSRTSVSLTQQDIEDSHTSRFTLNEYKRHLSKKWKKVKSNLIEVKERNFAIETNGRSALVKTTIVQTLEVNGVKTATTIYETTGIRLVKGKIYINYYSARFMLNTAMKVN